jgi:hypothetical protein
MIRFRRLTSFEQLRRFSSFPRSQPSRRHLLRYHSNAIKQENALNTWNTNIEYWHHEHDVVALFKSRKYVCHLSLLQMLLVCDFNADQQQFAIYRLYTLFCKRKNDAD